MWTAKLTQCKKAIVESRLRYVNRKIRLRNSQLPRRTTRQPIIKFKNFPA
jgi:hypothetical protein